MKPFVPFFIALVAGIAGAAPAPHSTLNPPNNPDYPNLKEIIVCWKSHCDIGYTHPVPEVIRNFRTGMMDKALKLIDASAALPREQRFVWALPAWVMELVLDEKQDPARRQRIEKAVHDGRLIWHALPFTFESEAADLEVLVRGLGCATRLAKRFGMPLPTDAKLTDMPTQSWTVPTLLRHAGIRFIHIGVNPWSPNPAVPNLFWWEGPDGSRVLTGYGFNEYGWGIAPPKGWQHKTWLCFQVQGDNCPPPSPVQVQDLLDDIKQQFPGIRVRFGRPSDFADAVIAENSDIPVIRADMPDTWTHGQMAMPVPTQQHRQGETDLISLGMLDTHLRGWGVTTDDVAPALAKGYDQGALYTEHTWGIAGPAFGSPDHATWKRNLATGAYAQQLGTFEYHADYARAELKTARDGLAPRLAALAGAVNCEGPRVTVFNPLPWPRGGTAAVTVPEGATLTAAMRDLDGGHETPAVLNGQSLTFTVGEIPPGGYRTYACIAGAAKAPATVQGDTLETAHFRVKFDTKRGGIASLISKTDNRELADTDTYALGQFMHERFSKDNVDAFLKAYCHRHYVWHGFPYYDFNKPRLDPAVTYARITPSGWTLRISRCADGDRAELTTTATEGLASGYALTFLFPINQPCVEITWKVDHKSPELIPEGGWLCLPLGVKSPAFRVSHGNAPFSPEKDLIAGSNRHIFSIAHGISVRDGSKGAGIGVASSDLPLWSIGEPGLWKYSNDYVPTKPLLFANLYNNMWNTNYPLWVDGSWSSTVRLWPVAKNTPEADALVCPAWEFRQGLLAGYADGAAGELPHVRSGLALSRKGVRVTAYCPNPDGDGTLLRVWEQRGESGEVTVTLPAPCPFTTAHRVSLRGEKIGEALPVRDHQITFKLGAYAPASFVLLPGLTDPSRLIEGP